MANFYRYRDHARLGDLEPLCHSLGGAGRRPKFLPLDSLRYGILAKSLLRIDPKFLSMNRGRIWLLIFPRLARQQFVVDVYHDHGYDFTADDSPEYAWVCVGILEALCFDLESVQS